MNTLPNTLSPHPILFTSGAISISAHGLFFALGALVSVLVMQRLAFKRGLSSERIPEWIFWTFLMGLIGARIGFFIIYPSAFESITQVLQIWRGGLVSYFGIICGLATISFLIRKTQKQNFLKYLDIFSLSALIGWGIGRIGNFLAGDVLGVASQTWQVFYGHVPISLFETLLCLLVFFNLSARKIADGQTVKKVLTYYFLGRFVIDFWRDETYLGLLHISQWTSLTLLICWVLLVKNYFRHENI